MATGKEKLEETIDVQIPQEAFDALAENDELLAIPDIAMAELMAGNLTDYLKGYHASNVTARAARQLGQDKAADDATKHAAYCRAAAAYIMYRYPGSKDIASYNMAKLTQRAKAMRDEDTTLIAFPKD